MNIEYELIAAKHIEGVKRIDQRAWYPYQENIPHKYTDANVSMDINMILHNSTWGKVAVVDGKVEAVVLAYSPYSLNSLARLGNAGGEEVLTLLEAPERFREEYRLFSRAYRDAYIDMKKKSKIQAEAEIYLLAVNPEMKGLGIGGTLFAEAINYLKKQGAKSYWIKTDTDCNYKFYDYKGLKLVGSRVVSVEKQLAELFADVDKDKLDLDELDNTDPYTCFLYVGEL